MRASLLVVLALLAVPWHAVAMQRTEQREPCSNSNPLRNPYFGDLHVHTAFSFDANALGVRSQPRDAYRFARGEALDVRPYDSAGVGQRRARLRRPLDFAAVTDHAEMLGETHICQSPDTPGYRSLICRVYRRWPLLAYVLINSRMVNSGHPTRYPFCGTDGEVCRTAALTPWRAIQEAAEEFYDRTSACRFTSFIAYEWSGNPDSNMIHRNVIFRNHVVPAYPYSFVEDPRPAGLWEALHRDCFDRRNGCDVLAIPHNSNLSNGWLFNVADADGTPISYGDALERATIEPLVEIVQHKGDSECRPGGTSPDELCTFEKLPYGKMDVRNMPFLWDPAAQRSFVREAVGEGLVQHERLGVNPFKLGIIGSTDTHMATPGLADEDTFLGHAAGGDTTNLELPIMPDSIELNPGGLAVVWAEENSRDALFEAMRRRETYGTSGPRMSVRFFGGWEYPSTLCGSNELVSAGYRGGVPMGGDLAPPPREDAAPHFVLSAMQDPGSADFPGAPLQRLQIIKLWTENGRARERVFDVAGDPRNGAGVDHTTCTRTGTGYDNLCTVWRDPEFNRAVPAAYYARVIENPSCRWSAYVCNAQRVDCANQSTVPRALASCCDSKYPRTIQERAWTSPIWYTPPTKSVAQ